MNRLFISGALWLMILALMQNVSFTVTSRSRNRSSWGYHLIASVFSNGIWFLTFRQLVLADMTFSLLPFYIVGTIAGSLYGVSLSMKIESWLGATSDSHIKKDTTDLDDLKKRVIELESTLRALETNKTPVHSYPQNN